MQPKYTKKTYIKKTLFNICNLEHMVAKIVLKKRKINYIINID